MTPEQMKQMKQALGTLGDEHPVWLALVSFFDAHAEEDSANAATPGLDNEARQFNCGRLSRTLDLWESLVAVRASARSPRRPAEG